MVFSRLAGIEDRLQEIALAYPVGPQSWSKRLVFSVGALATASLLALSGAQAPRMLPGSIADPSMGDASAQAATSPSKTAPEKRLSAGATPSGRLPMPRAKQEDASMGVAWPVLRALEQAPFVEVGAMESLAGEAKNVFLIRVAQTMDLFTRTTGHEICGVLMVSPENDAYKIRLTTNRSHIACTMVVFDEPGFRRMGPDMHSHPRFSAGALANNQDILRRPDFTCGQVIHIQDESFSPVDLNRGPGYLVSRGRLLFQHGEQWPIQQVAVFNSIEVPSDLSVGGGGNPQADESLAAMAWQGEDRSGLPVTDCPDSGILIGEKTDEQKVVAAISQIGVADSPPSVRRPARGLR